MVSQADKWGEDWEEDGGVFPVDLLPGGVGDPVPDPGLTWVSTCRELVLSPPLLAVAPSYQAIVWGGGERLLYREEVVQQDFVHLVGILSPSEGGEAGRGSAIGEPLVHPQGLAGGA